MPLTIHHLGKSQSERIVWLCEELAIPYELVVHDRNPETALAPDSLKAVHAAGTAPAMVDDPSPLPGGGSVKLGESGAIAEYIAAVHGGGRLILTPRDKGYTDYLEWFHFSNASIQPTLGRMMMLGRAGVADDSFPMKFVNSKWDTTAGMIEAQLKKTGAFLAGAELSLADIMTVFTLSTMRGFRPVDLSPYPEILAYLKRISERDAYKRAMEKGDPGLEPMIGATVKPFVFGKK